MGDMFYRMAARFALSLVLEPAQRALRPHQFAVGMEDGCTQVVHTFSDPERATQVDISARVAHRLTKHAELLYGLRYLNYNANYDDFPGQLADRNVGFAPTIGLRVRL